ncbi:MAG: hypothetical protein LDLANPLL_00353 [Turneriella sp.]|nr:hypothetical protein [Turneriella sp.]
MISFQLRNLLEKLGITVFFIIGYTFILFPQLHAEDAPNANTKKSEAVTGESKNTKEEKTPNTKKDSATAANPPVALDTKEEKLDEISDDTGKIFKAKVLGIGENEILIKDPETGQEKTLSTKNLIFARLAVGKYYFFLPPESEKTERKKDAPEKQGGSNAGAWEIIFGVGMHLADNSDVPKYLGEEAESLSDYYRTRYSTNFPVEPGVEGGAVHWQFFAEHRFHWENYFLGFGVGYAILPKSSSVVSSSFSGIQSTINMSGFFLPVYAAYYYRVWQSGAWDFNFGFGVGGMYTVITEKIVGGPSANEQTLTSFTPLLMLKPEFTYAMGRVRLIASVPLYWAQAHDITDGEETLMMHKSKNIVATGLSGIGFELALGYNY